MARHRLVVATLLTATIASLSACGGGDSVTTTEQATAAGSPTPAPTPAPAPAPSPAPAPAPTASLSWTASPDTDVAGYRVYYGTSSGTYVQSRGAGIVAGKVTAYTVTGLQSGTTYYFAVTSFDSAGNESAYSGEVSKQIQ